MSAPLLFVCRHVPDASSVEAQTEFVPLRSPDGPVLQAFESHQLAAFLWAFYGSAENVFLLPETDLTPEQSARIAGHRVVIFRTGEDYDGATLEDTAYPWNDRVVRYDPSSVVTRRVVGGR